MARQTKQAIIDELTEINIKQQEDIKKLESKIKRHDSNYKKALKQVEELKEKIQELNNGTNKKNARGAGRKSRFDEQTIEMIKMYRLQGMTIKALAEQFGCSHGLIGNIIKGFESDTKQ